MATTAGVIGFQQRHTYRDYVELNAASFKAQAARVVLLALAIVMLTMPLYVQPKSGTAPSVWVVAPWAVLLALLGLFGMRMRAWLPWRGSADRVGPVQVEISRTGVTLIASQGEMAWAWADFSSVSETRNLLLLWNARAPAFVSLLKAPMQEAGVLDEVQARIRSAGLRRRRWLP